MKHRNAATARLTNNFERFNPYIELALEHKDEDVSELYAFLGIAFELSQLRYHISKRGLDNDSRARVTSHGKGSHHAR